jgi:hypothetical protein
VCERGAAVYMSAGWSMCVSVSICVGVSVGRVCV